MKTRLLRGALMLAAFTGTLAVVPAWWCARDAAAWYAGDLDLHRGLARTVVQQLRDRPEAGDFRTGSALFSGEWLFGTYLMAGIGFCQLVRAHPETADEFVPWIEHCIEQIASERVREFDTLSWKADAFQPLEGGRGHAAYLGNLNLLLSLYREIHPRNRFSPLNDALTAELQARMAASPSGLIETYPGEWYPVDNSPVLASIAMHRRVMDRGSDEELVALEAKFRRHAVDPRTGLLFQALAGDGSPADAPRGSGSALGAFFLGHGLQPLAREIHAAIRRELSMNVLGFGAVREYPRGAGGGGDIDSGPIVFGMGFSATGFSVGGARMCGDSALFRRLWASAQFAGAPIDSRGGTRFLTAGPLGNAILLAMLTARPEGGP